MKVVSVEARGQPDVGWLAATSLPLQFSKHSFGNIRSVTTSSRSFVQINVTKSHHIHFLVHALYLGMGLSSS